jgi:hypothetical protein
MSLKEAAQKILDSNIEYDQLICEYWKKGTTSGWIHVSYAPQERKPRKQALMIGEVTNGKYEQLDLSKL